MPDFELPQLLLLRTANGIEVVARSDGIGFDHEEFARRTAVAYGERPSNHPGFEAVFALPFDRAIAVATVFAPEDTSAYALAMRFLFVPEALYRWLGDPFAIAARHTINPQARGRLPTLTWDADIKNLRRVLDLQNVLKSGDSPLLLGAAQALVDGTRIRISADRPHPALRGLWQLLPDSTRSEVWPCEYCFVDELPVHIAVLPQLPARLPPGTINDEQTRDYPAGRYEMALQAAVEIGDQRAVDQLLARRAPRDVLRMAVGMLIFAAVAAIVMKFFRD